MSNTTSSSITLERRLISPESGCSKAQDRKIVPLLGSFEMPHEPVENWKSSDRLFFLLGYFPREQHHGVPGHLSVVEDKAPDPGKGFSTPWFKGHSCQGVGAQVQELQVWDVGHDFADLE